ncbi:MAG: TRAP transporter substrate-binding protein [Martelella sp.]|uniref:TRAP transporter substrate-binding protein n=1 Tax=Martelella sp. TaxID=1969699 RepID=UPI003242D4E2
MKSTILKSLAAGTIASLFLLSAAHAETWRMAMDVGLESPEGKGIQKFAELVDEYSDGDLTITLFPYEQLGSADAVGEQLSQGLIQMQSAGLVRMAKWLPAIQYMNAPFLFEDREHWVRFMNSDVVKAWFDEAEEKGGVAVLGDPTAFLRGPYRVIVATTPVESIDDVKGLRLRMHPDDLAVAAWSALGADVRVMPWSDVYQGLQRSTIDAVNSPIALVESTRFQEVAPNVSRHDEYWQSVGFMVNAKALNALSEKDRTALEKAYAEAAAYGTAEVEKGAAESIERMKADGVMFYDIDTAPFSAIMAQYYNDHSAELPDGFVEAVDATRSDN